MFKSIFLFTLLTATSWALAQDEQAGKAKIVFENSTHDFGDIDRGEKVTANFSFKNSGDGALTIKEITTSCGCTSAKPEKTQYAPGESGEISVTFDSTRFSGAVTKQVTVFTNVPKKEKTILEIKGHIVTEILSKPAHIFIPDARLGKVSRTEIMVTTTRLEKLEISNLKTSADFLSATQERIDDKAIRIWVMADGAKFPAGQARPRGVIEYETNGKTQSLIQTNITINVVSPISVHPRYLMFYASQEGRQREINVRLVANDETTFQIDTMKSSLDFVTVEKESDLPGETAFKVVLTKAAPEGKFKGKVTIRTTHPEQKKIVIPLRGSVIKKQ